MVVDYQLEYPPTVMDVKARELLERLGYHEKPADSKGGFFYNADWFRHIAETDDSVDRWERLGKPGPPVFGYWYRESPEPLVNYLYFTPNLAGGLVTSNAPPRSRTGMLRMLMDDRGRLSNLMVYPPQFDEEPDTGEYDWGALLAEAGFDIEAMTSAESQWVPPHYAHERRAWVGTYEGEDAVPVRIEAARYGNKPVYFATIDPWTKPTRQTRDEQSVKRAAGTLLQMAIFIGIIVGSIVLARRNIRMGRGDKRGAYRLSIFVFASMMAMWLLGADHVAAASEFGLFWIGLSWSLIIATFVWLLYVALEPFIRRRWPTMLISWNRLLGGRIADPLVGRDVLVGTSLGATLTLLVPYVAYLVEKARGVPTPPPQSFSLGGLSGTRSALFAVVNHIPTAVAFGFILAFLLLAFRLLLRKEWLALGAVSVLAATLSILTSSGTTSMLLWPIVWIALFTVLVKFGVLATTCMIFSTNVLEIAAGMPGSATSWTGVSVWTALAAILGLTIWGFWQALAGRPVIDTES